MSDNDAVNHPGHYTSHPSGVECIQITEHMSFCLGNAVKYIWRADLKGNEIEDLRKARWYVDREIARSAASPPSWMRLSPPVWRLRQPATTTPGSWRLLLSSPTPKPYGATCCRRTRQM
ncbi:DUF3310 domain-containing protein [Rhodococcus hoagii]|nr:DUF3310 domain-containing protein [Prescottella equi]